MRRHWADMEHDMEKEAETLLREVERDGLCHEQKIQNVTTIHNLLCIHYDQRSIVSITQHGIRTEIIGFDCFSNLSLPLVSILK